MAIDEPSSRAGDALAGEPLDPAVENIRRKLARLVLLGVGTLLIGLVAVFAAVLYRWNAEPSTAAGNATLQLLPGATVRSATLSDGGLLLTIDLPDGAVDLVVLDPLTGGVRSQVTIQPAMP